MQIKHIPSGISIKYGKSRSREENRFFALRELCVKLKEKVTGIHPIATKIAKMRKQKKRKMRKSVQKHTLGGSKTHSKKENP